MMGHRNITDWNHIWLKAMVKHPGLCVDATAGTGRDTLFLCSLGRGPVLAMDIQEEAIERTRRRLEESGQADRVRLICDGHEHMDRYVEEGCADLILFNLGYLPGGDHRKATRPDTTIRALEKSLKILAPGGVINMMIYSGGDTGFAEKDAVLEYIKKLDCREYTVIEGSFPNRPNHPPIPVFIMREGGKV